MQEEGCCLYCNSFLMSSLGCLVFLKNTYTFQIAVGITLTVLGVLYVVASFLKGLPDLNGMSVNFGAGGIEVVEHNQEGNEGMDENNRAPMPHTYSAV